MTTYPFDTKPDPNPEPEQRTQIPLSQIIGSATSMRPSTSPHPSLNAVFEEVPALRVRGKYIPLLETLRLYAGWLLGWYFLIYVLGGYQMTRSLPFRLPYVEDLVSSTSVAVVSFIAFLFLLLTSLHRVRDAKPGSGIALTAAGVVLLVGFWLSL